MHCLTGTRSGSGETEAQDHHDLLSPLPGSRQSRDTSLVFFGGGRGGVSTMGELLGAGISATTTCGLILHPRGRCQAGQAGGPSFPGQR